MSFGVKPSFTKNLMTTQYSVFSILRNTPLPGQHRRYTVDGAFFWQSVCQLGDFGHEIGLHLRAYLDRRDNDLIEFDNCLADEVSRVEWDHLAVIRKGVFSTQ